MEELLQEAIGLNVTRSRLTSTLGSSLSVEAALIGWADRQLNLWCGLLKPENVLPGHIVQGLEFRNFTVQERLERVDQIRVLAAATPSDKSLMVQSLKDKGRMVAYVGRGLGDAQAIKEANVGLYYRTEWGAEILNSSSDIVIRENNLLLILEILKWGRGFYGSIQTYTQFWLSAIFVDLVTGFVMTIFPKGSFSVYEMVSSGEEPIPILQLLWVKLILGAVASLSTLTKRPSDDLLSKPPRDPNEPLVTDGMHGNMSAQALYQILALLAIHFTGETLLNMKADEKSTVIFNTYVLCQIFMLINAKLYVRRNISGNMRVKKWFWGIIDIIVILQLLMVEVLKSIAGMRRLDFKQWGLCIFIAAASTPITWLLRYIAPLKIPYLSSAQGLNPKSKGE
ncbi:OLC1v1019904C1 [Oldenlandia corymbosa var. corymbosa]|uniref:OLC1v1019904C1 n=1 Tax=Oldenlandia corymbosa var. corymbosa TaxID=529605 RepID=A0AAV1EFD4_OLDCO|nr:OLC1v1019904C1 [Oldenlandia corymbosa var. corymbosa]